MGNKNDLREMLDNLSQEEIASLGKMLAQISNKSNNRKRGRGTRKRKNKKKTPETKEADFMDGVTLSADEIREIGEASQFDKQRGLDKPKGGSIIPKAPQFQKASLKCMSCGKTFEVAPALIPPERGRFKCNSCSCSAG